MILFLLRKGVVQGFVGPLLPPRFFIAFGVGRGRGSFGMCVRHTLGALAGTPGPGGPLLDPPGGARTFCPGLLCGHIRFGIPKQTSLKF